MAVLREDRFGVELHALDWQRAVAHAHDLAVLGPRRDLEIARAALALDRERMVPGRVVRRGQAAEHSGAGVVDARDLAVHEGLRMDDAPAERLADGLVAEAHAEDRHAVPEPLDHAERDARFIGRARPRRKHDSLGREALDL